MFSTLHLSFFPTPFAHLYTCTLCNCTKELLGLFFFDQLGIFFVQSNIYPIVVHRDDTPTTPLPHLHSTPLHCFDFPTLHQVLREMLANVLRTQRRCLSEAGRMFVEQRQADYTPARWGDGAGSYARTLHSKYLAYAEDGLALLDGHHPGPTLGSLLDIGCGTGAIPHAISEFGLPFNSISAIDSSPDMISATTSRTATLPFSVTVQQMDGHNLSFPNASFDTTTAMFSILFFEDKQKGLSEMCRVTKPGGRGLITGWTKDVDWIAYSNKALVNVLGDRLPKCRSDDGERPSFLAFADSLVFEGMLKEAGWMQVKIATLNIAFNMESEQQTKEFWLAIASSYPTLAFVMDTFPEEERHDLKNQIATEFARLTHEGLSSPGNYASLRGIATVAFTKK